MPEDGANAGEPEAIDPLRLDFQLCFALYTASNLMTRLYHPLLQPLGITYLQYVALLSEADRLLIGGDTQTGLAYLGMLRRAAAMGSVEQHEAQRILDRVELPPDAIARGLAAGEALQVERVIQELLARRA